MSCLLSPVDDPLSCHSSDIKSNPTSCDWHERGYVTKARDQGPLPVCWIFSAVSAVESHNAITNGELIELSVQQLVDDMPEGDKTGYISAAFNYIKEHGSIRESEYPQRCPFQRGKSMRVGKEVAVEIKHWKSVKISNPSNPEADLETVVAQIGPVAALMVISSKDQLTMFCSMAGTDDIFFDPGPHLVNQLVCLSVLVVGYGSQPDRTNTNTENYWIVKTSLGNYGNNDGFYKIAKDRGNNCFIASYAMYPVVKKH